MTGSGHFVIVIEYLTLIYQTKIEHQELVKNKFMILGSQSLAYKIIYVPSLCYILEKSSMFLRRKRGKALSFSMGLWN